MTGKVKFEGVADLEINAISCVCGYCGNTDKKDALIEFNFPEQRVVYVCGKCKKNNYMQFGKDQPPPYPRARFSK